MTLVVCNRSTQIVPVHFQLELGNHFYCAGRTNGGHTVQPLSTSKIKFYLIGVTPGNVPLPGIVAERIGGEKLIQSSQMGNIMCFP